MAAFSAAVSEEIADVQEELKLLTLLRFISLGSSVAVAML
jgi:hypothetical protein